MGCKPASVSSMKPLKYAVHYVVHSSFYENLPRSSASFVQKLGFSLPENWYASSLSDDENKWSHHISFLS